MLLQEQSGFTFPIRIDGNLFLRMSMVAFHYADIKSRIRQKQKLLQFVRHLFIAEKKSLKKIDVVFCTDEYLLSLNRHFLNHDYFTDILTFNNSFDHSDTIIGELYISLDRIRENSIQFEAIYEIELIRVIFHGLLHLCGYNDSSQADKVLMRQKENFYLKQFETFHVETK